MRRRSLNDSGESARNCIALEGMEGDMRCLLCRNLEAAFQARWSEYSKASSLACYGVNNQSAAYLHVEMERARAELEEHLSICFSAANEPARMPVSSQVRNDQRKEVKSRFVSTAA
jgi:hypothetical protein